MALDEATRSAFVAWYIAPESERSTRKLFAELHEVNESTLTRWTKQDWFKREVDLAYSKLELSPDRLQAVVDALEEKARTGDPRAVDLYLKHYEKVHGNTNEDIAISDLSDTELESALQDELEAVRERLAVTG